MPYWPVAIFAPTDHGCGRYVPHSRRDMSEEDTRPLPGRDGVGRAMKSTMTWTAVATVLLLIQYFARAGLPPFWQLIELVSRDVAAVLPFAAVAGGLRLAGHQGRRLRAAAVAGLAVAAATYFVSALVTPLTQYAGLAWGDRGGAVIEMFGIQTPAGILRNLEYVRAYPPAEYSMSVEYPDREYPARLVLALHLPAATAATALLNTFVGLALGRATLRARPRTRRRTRWSVVLAGTVVVVVAGLLAQGPNRDWESVSGVVAAWVPLVVPAAQIGVLALVVRWRDGVAHRRSGRYLVEDGRL